MTVRYLGLAILYAAGVTALVWGLVRLSGRRPSARMIRFVLGVAFVICLGLHPLPDPVSFDCAMQGRPIMLTPFSYMPEVIRLWQAGVPPLVWMRNLTVISTVMNFAIFAGVGMLAAPLLPGAVGALLLGLGISGFIEISQLSGFYGLYDCPYRYFDIDDLILNGTGMLAGYWLFRWGQGKRRSLASSRKNFGPDE